jgi:hypothetical protein
MEVEVKIPITGAPPFQKLGYRLLARQHEYDLVFDNEAGEVRGRGCLLRLLNREN